METQEKKPRVKLIGRDSNPFAVLGACREAAKKAKWSQEKIDAFIEEAKSSNYEHLLVTCCDYFDVK